jgi:hypothetical protein
MEDSLQLDNSKEGTSLTGYEHLRNVHLNPSKWGKVSIRAVPAFELAILRAIFHSKGLLLLEAKGHRRQNFAKLI